MLTKITITALIILGASGLGAAFTFTDHIYSPKNEGNENMYCLFKALATISFLVLVGCGITAVWTN